MNDLDYINVNLHKTFQITHEKMQATKEKSIDARAIRMNILKNLEEESNEQIQKEKYSQYQRRNKTPPNHPINMGQTSSSFRYQCSP